MSKKQEKIPGFATRAIRSGINRTRENEHSEPIFPTSSFLFESASEAAARFSGEVEGNVYSRFTNPTVKIFEQRLAELELGERAVATASGMSAILSVCMGLLKSGDHILSSRSLFGSTVQLFENFLKKFGVEVSYVSPTDLEAWKLAVQVNTKLFFLETPSNPLTEIADISILAQLAHANGALLVVDNCFCTPALQQPLELGADIVVHSATKFLDGQGRCVGGAVVGPEALVGGDIYSFLRTGGPCMSPFNAWVFIKGLETLNLRMKAHSENALALALWLEQQASVERVYYPGLVSHPQHELARVQQRYFGGILSFDLKGGKQQAWGVIDSLQMLSITANLGDVKTTVTHPSSTTHSRMTSDQRDEAGIGDGLVRISVGLEDLEDIKADLRQGLSEGAL